MRWRRLPSIRSGEVLPSVGDNGAANQAPLKILAGTNFPESGELLLARPAPFAGVSEPCARHRP